MTDGNASRPVMYMLAMDHRGSFERLHAKSVPDWTARAQTERVAMMRRHKRVAFDALVAAVGAVPAENTAVLVDEWLGHEVAERATAGGVTLAMPVEKSGQDVFDFQYGDDFGEHLTRYDVDFAKALVRYNPEGDGDGNRTQAERLRRLSDWCAERRQELLLEVLVPAEEAQLAAVSGDRDAYDRELRPELTRRAMEELQHAGVRADVWKLEGVDDGADAASLAAQARAVDAGVRCVVLGRGADRQRVDHWLRQAAPQDGYIGFAIGRSVFSEEVTAHIDGAIDRDEAVRRIASRYRHFVAVYEDARAAAVRGG
jgi:5-dehydro-2-deoxygluconokinase